MAIIACEAGFFMLVGIDQKSTSFRAQLAHLMQIRCKFNAQLGLVDLYKNIEFT